MNRHLESESFLFSLVFCLPIRRHYEFNLLHRVPDSSRPSIIWVSFQEPTVGCKQRKEFSHLYSEQIEKNWTPVLEITRQFQLFQKKQVQVFRRQFPLRPASAKTIHRCQGDTMNEAVIDLPCSKKDHMHYVALSRLRNISGLHVLKLYEDKISTSEKVQEEICITLCD